MIFTLFQSVIGAVANGFKCAVSLYHFSAERRLNDMFLCVSFPRLLVLFPTTLPYLYICSDPLAPNVGCAMCLHLFSHLCFRHIQLFCLLVICSYMAYCSSVLLEHETGSPVFSKAVAQVLRRIVLVLFAPFNAETQFCSTILRRPVVSSASFSEDFRRDFYDGLQLSEIEFCEPASAQVCCPACTMSPHDVRVMQAAPETVTSNIDFVRFVPGITRDEGVKSGRIE